MWFRIYFNSGYAVTAQDILPSMSGHYILEKYGDRIYEEKVLTVEDFLNLVGADQVIPLRNETLLVHISP